MICIMLQNIVKFIIFQMISTLNFNHSIKKINKQVNYDLKNLNNWLNAQIMSLKVSKTEVVLFKSLKHRF